MKLPACFFHQNSGQSLSLIHSVTATLKIHMKALAEKVNCQAPLQCRSSTQTFFLFACAKGHAYCPHKANPSHLWGGRYSTQAKAAIPLPHMLMLSVSMEMGNNVTSHSSSLQQVEGMVSNTLSDGTHIQTLLSPLDCQPTQPVNMQWSSQGPWHKRVVKWVLLWRKDKFKSKTETMIMNSSQGLYLCRGGICWF